MTVAVKLTGILNGPLAFLTDTGLVNAGGYIEVYQAGTDTLQDTYTDNTGGTPNANPLPLNPYGQLSNPVWGIVGQAYKFIMFDVNSVQIGIPWDNITNIDDIPYTAYTFGTFLNVNGSNNVSFSIPQTAPEIAASITPSATQYFPGDIRRLGGGNDNSNFTNYALDSGVANAYIMKYAFSAFAYVVGETYQFIAANTNTGPSTATINGITKPIILISYTPLVGGEIVAGTVNVLVYNGTDLVLIANTILADQNSAVRSIVADFAYEGITQAPGDSSNNLATTAFVNSLATTIFTSTSSGIVPESGTNTTAVLHADGTWIPVLTTSTFADNGYARIDGGLIFQWGLFNSAVGDTTIMFPLTWPTKCLSITHGPGSTTDVGGFGTVTTSSFIYNNGNVVPIYWIAIGH